MENIMSVSDIKEGMTNWSVKVTVQEKLQPAQGLNSPTRYQKFVFADEKGSRVQGILFDNEIDKMASKIEACKKYVISNAKVKNIQQRYQVDGLTMQWIISSRTVIQEVPSNDDDNMILPLNYTKFKDFAEHMDNKISPIDILVVVIHALPIKNIQKENEEITLQNFVVIDEEMQPVMLTMWNSFLSKEGQQIIENLQKLPIVICYRVKVVCYNGVALSTRIDSAILVDPPVLEAKQLKIWAMTNENELRDIVHDKSYNKYNPQLSILPNQKFTLVAHISPTQKNAWVKVKLSFEHISQRYWYMACNKCFRSTDASYGYVFTCNSCSEKQKAEPRCCVDVDLTDESGTITATIFGDLAEQFLTFSALEAMKCSQHVHIRIQSFQFS